MNTDDMVILVESRLRKAYDDLKAGQLMFDEGFYNQSLNRSYYAIFHAARAVLATHGLDSSKHSGIIALYNQHFVASGILDKKFSRIIFGAERARNKSDYNDFYEASGEEAEKQLKDAIEFLSETKGYLDAWKERQTPN